MVSATEIRARIERVTCVSSDERERIYHKYFTAPSATVRFLCRRYQFDQRRVLDVACDYGYHLVHFGEGSTGIDGTRRFVQFADEMGLTVHQANFEDGFPDLGQTFEGIFFSGTLEEIYSPHLLLMRLRKLLAPDGLLVVSVPTVPPAWMDRLIRLRIKPGYEARNHFNFFTPRLLQFTIERAGYETIQLAIPAIQLNRWLRPVHSAILPMTIAVTIVARPLPGFMYPDSRGLPFLPAWAQDLAPYHTDYPTIR